MQNNTIEWREVELRYLGELIMGQSPKGESYNNQKKGTPLLNGAADIKNNKIIPKQFTTKPTKLSKKGDILFCIRATIGKSIISDGEYCLGRGVAGFRVNQDLLETRFLLKILDKKLKGLVLQGSTIVGVKGKDIESIRIPLPFKDGKPCLKEQERAVKILEKAEKLKESGRNAEVLLEEYLKSVFNEMFYDKGFEEVKLEEICELKSGGTPSRTNKDYFNGNLPWITTVVLGKKYITKKDAMELITLKAVEESATKIIPKGSILIGTRVGVGKVSVNLIDICVNQDITSLTNIDKRLINEYLLFLLNNEANYLLSQVRGATIKGIPSSVLKSLKIPIPPLQLQQKFAKIVEQAEKMKENLKKTKGNSEELFNSLMQKAFRGEL